jgi:hypothetical protein
MARKRVATVIRPSGAAVANCARRATPRRTRCCLRPQLGRLGVDRSDDAEARGPVPLREARTAAVIPPKRNREGPRDYARDLN